MLHPKGTRSVAGSLTSFRARFLFSMLLELEQVSERSETPKYLIIQDTLWSTVGQDKGLAMHYG